MTKMDLKIKKINKLLGEINNLYSEVYKLLPPKGFVVIYTTIIDDFENIKIKEFFTLEDANRWIDFITGPHPDHYKFMLLQKVKAGLEE